LASFNFILFFYFLFLDFLHVQELKVNGSPPELRRLSRKFS
jgi:hypothetical protein